MSQLCPRCGTPVRPRLVRCGVCGADVAPAAEPENAAPARRSSASPWAMSAAIFVTLFVVITLLGAALLFGGGGDSGKPVADTASEPAAAGSPTPVTEPTPVDPTPTPADPTTGSPTSAATGPASTFDASALPSGLFCRDLLARGLSYGDAVAYWELEGRTGRMDSDRNDIPCETVYEQSLIDAYWAG